MRALLQRVKEARVEVDGGTVAAIGHGLLVFVGIHKHDTEAEAAYVADKVVNLRIFEDEEGKFNLSALDVDGQILVVSQFTLYGDTRKGRRPGFDAAAPAEKSEPLYEAFAECIRSSGLETATGFFGAMMDVYLINDGPVTITVERERPAE